MIPLHIKHFEEIILSFDDEINSHWESIRGDIADYERKLTDAKEIEYLKYLRGLGKEIIVASPQRIIRLKKDFGKIIPVSEMRTKEKTVFREKLIDLMGYAKLRTSFYPKYFFKSGIKTCVYCNALLTIVVEKIPEIGASSLYQAKFQTDHYLPKKDHPCFSISLFNLYPVCANCNIVKGVKKINFDLYASNIVNVSPYKFRLADGCEAKYLLTRNLDDIEIEFDEPPVLDGYESFNSLFSIKDIYNTQRDVAAELILKAEAYPQSYRDTLLNSLPKLFRDRSVVNNLITGNYSEEKDIHKRPLAKFTMDISHQLGLLLKDEK